MDAVKPAGYVIMDEQYPCVFEFTLRIPRCEQKSLGIKPLYNCLLPDAVVFL